MDDYPENQTPSAKLPAGIWTTWQRSEILGLFFMTLTGNFFFQYILFSAVGGMFWPVMGGGLLGVFLPLLVVLKLRRLDLQLDFFLDKPPLRVMVASGLMAVATLVPTSLLGELSLRLSPADPEIVAFMQEQLPTTGPGIMMAALAVVVIAPLAEEILFRGLLHRLASGIWGPLAATAVSSLVFGIIHGEPWILFGLIGVGAVLAFIFEATGSVTACWITHAVHNAISLFFMTQQGIGSMEPTALTVSDWSWGIVSVVVAVFIGRYLLAIKSQNPADLPQD